MSRGSSEWRVRARLNRSDNLERLLAGGRWRRAAVFVGAGLVLIVAIAVAGEDISHHVEAIESRIARLGPWGVVAFIGLYVIATSFLLPESALSIIAGAMFGLTLGFVAVVVGSLLSAALQYGLSRRLLCVHVQQVLDTKPALAAIQRAVHRNELKLQLLVRMTPLNPAVVSYLFGASGVRFAGFLLACLGFIPHLFLEAYFGYAGRHVAHMASGTVHGGHFHDVVVIGGLVAVLIVMIILSRTAHKALSEAVSELGKETDGR